MKRVMGLPGWLHTARVWNPLSAHLPDGCGLQALSWEHVLDVEGLLKQLNAVRGHVFLVGWSMGAMAALRCAIEAPNKVEGLFLMGATARLPAATDYDGVAVSRLRAMKRALRQSPHRCYDQFLALCGHAAEAAATIRDEALTVPVDRSLAGLEALEQWDLRGHLKRVQCAVSLCHGSGDAVVPPAQAVFLEHHLPAAQLTVVPGAPHVPTEQMWRQVGGQLHAVLKGEKP